MPRRDLVIFVGSCAAVLVAGALVAAGLIVADLPCPRGDDAFYKSPAAELVQTGRLSQPCVVGYLPRADEFFAAYPPLYQLALAGWFEVFGFSLRSAVAFHHAVHLLNVAGVLALVGVVLPRHVPVSARVGGAVATGLVLFGTLRFFDRPEELALLPCWLELLLYQREQSAGCSGAAVSGVLLGVCSLVSPWTGLVFVGVLVLREFFAPAGRVRLLLVAVAALVPVLGWLAWLEATHPRIVVEQLFEHGRRSHKVSILTEPSRFFLNLLYTPYPLPALLFTFVGIPRLRWAAKPLPSMISSLFWGALGGLTLAALGRANSYNYIWLCLFFLFPCFGYLVGQLLAEARSGERCFLWGIVVLCTFVALRDPISLEFLAWELPDAERSGPVFDQLAKAIPTGEPVATTARYWYLFQGRNPWRDTAITPWLSRTQRREARWIVIPVDYGEPEFRRMLTDGFELVERQPAWDGAFAPTCARSERTWAYELYRRRERGNEGESGE